MWFLIQQKISGVFVLMKKVLDSREVLFIELFPALCVKEEILPTIMAQEGGLFMGRNLKMKTLN